MGQITGEEDRMASTMTREEKIVLIAVMRYIVTAGSVITDSEVEGIDDLAHEPGFEDFRGLFDEVDRSVKSKEDLEALIRRVTNPESRKSILKRSLEFSRADANFDPRETGILDFMSREWGIDLDSMINQE